MSAALQITGRLKPQGREDEVRVDSRLALKLLVVEPGTQGGSRGGYLLIHPLLKRSALVSTGWPSALGPFIKYVALEGKDGS